MTRTGSEWLAHGERAFVRNYRQQPLVLARGEGSVVWDVEGNRYLDMTAGIAVCCLGHAHPELTGRLSEQLSRLTHVSNLYWNDRQIEAAEAITERSFADRVFFCNSGAEANEAAIKLVRRWQRVVAGHPERTRIIATTGSFHGRSLATVSITGQSKYREGFGPLFGPVDFVPFGDLAAARAALEHPEACAFFVEPIQAEGGILVPDDGYLRGLRAACDATDTLLVVDEVQTGVGRTGRWWGHEHDGATPDVMTLAKGLGGGIPIGCVAATARAARGLEARTGEAVPHASTFGGNPLASAAAVAVIEIISRDGLLERARTSGAHLGALLAGVCASTPRAVEARGRGLLRGLRVTGDAPRVVARCRERGVLLSLAGADVVRFVPSFLVSLEQLESAVATLGDVLAEE